MRIDGPNPIPAGVSQPVARESRTASPPEAAPPIADHLATQPKPQGSGTRVVVEMLPGSISVYKFIDQASGQLIDQIPSEQMLELAQAIDLAGKSTKSK